MKLPPEVLELLACPQCRSPLQPVDGAEELACTDTATGDCGLIYPVRNDIPVLLVESGRRPGGDQP